MSNPADLHPSDDLEQVVDDLLSLTEVLGVARGPKDVRRCGQEGPTRFPASHGRSLTGGLNVVLLPLKSSGPVGGPRSSFEYEYADSESTPFLPARAGLALDPSSFTSDATGSSADPKSPLSEPDPSAWDVWGSPVLIASRDTLAKMRDEGVTFGHAASWFDEGETDPEVWQGGPSMSVSLWLVPHVGFVLAYEDIRRGVDLGARCMSMDRLMRLPVGVSDTGNVRASERQSGWDRLFSLSGTSAWKSQSLPHDPEDLHLDYLLDVIARELAVCNGHGLAGGENRKQAPCSGHLLTLHCLFPALEGLPLATEKTLRSLVIERPKTVDQHRLVEGLTITLAASGNAEDLGLDMLVAGVESEEVDTEFWQNWRYAWPYERRAVVTKPSRESAHMAVRTDGRSVAIDLDALSIHHDYMGWGGDRIVVELISLAARLGERSSQKRELVQVTQSLTTKSTGAAGAAEKVTDLYMRNEAYGLLVHNLRNEPNFASWTNDHSLRRILAPISLLGEEARAEDERFSRSLNSLESMLRSRAREEAQEAQNRTRRVFEVGLGLISVVGIIALLPAIASIPNGERLVDSVWAAASWTAWSVVLLGLVAWLYHRYALARPPEKRQWAWTATVFTLGTATAYIVSVLAGFQGTNWPTRIFVQVGTPLAVGAIAAVAFHTLASASRAAQQPHPR
jgi:hypothetical protein